MEFGFRINGEEPRPILGREPWKNSWGKARCLQHLVNGSVDILINIAMCKGHSSEFGGLHDMKNHFAPSTHRQASRRAQDYLLAINQTSEILVPWTRRRKSALSAQQLCIVDALWPVKVARGISQASTQFFGHGGISPSLITCWPPVSGREDGLAPQYGGHPRFLTDFGYSEKTFRKGERS